MHGGPGGKATVPALFMIRKAFTEQQMGYACAVGIVLTAIVMALQKLLTWFMRERQPRAAGVGRARPAPAAPSDATVFARAEARRRGRIERQNTPWRRAMRRMGGRILRLNKHLFIWLVLAFAFLPLYLMVVVSFKSNTQFYAAPGVLTPPLHPENWIEAWRQVMPTVANSVFLSTAVTALTLCFALCAAYFFARQKMPLSGFFWNAILVLMMMPMIANLVPLFHLLLNLNLVNTFAALILVGAASGQVFAIFVLRNFVADIPADLYEAAEIDGASHFRQLRHIVLPLSGPILGTVGVMQFIAAWNEFVLPLIVMRDHARLPVMVQLLRMAGEYLKYWGPLMAGYAMASIPIILLFLFAMKLFVRGLTEGAVKG
jgi:ABC-type glycerol-3-phosphate transport system permease component